MIYLLLLACSIVLQSHEFAKLIGAKKTKNPVLARDLWCFEWDPKIYADAGNPGFGETLGYVDMFV